jgi:hypothetical protein
VLDHLLTGVEVALHHTPGQRQFLRRGKQGVIADVVQIDLGDIGNVLVGRCRFLAFFGLVLRRFFLRSLLVGHVFFVEDFDLITHG